MALLTLRKTHVVLAQDDRDFSSGAESGEEPSRALTGASTSGRAALEGSKTKKIGRKARQGEDTADLEMLMMDDGDLLVAREGAVPAVLRTGVVAAHRDH